MTGATLIRTAAFGLALLGVGGCGNGFDLDLRSLGNGLDTSDAALAGRSRERPLPDRRGVISYPDYQVAVARPGDTLADVAGRVGLPAEELARYNGIPATAELRGDELVALPRRVTETSPTPGAVTTGPIRTAGEVDVRTIASDAIDRVSDGPAAAAPPQTGPQPIRHRVAAGETAFSIARQYGVPVQSLSEWNGLDADMSVRVGQVLLIPPVERVARAPAEPSAPGAGTASPAPPSAAKPLPERDEAPVAAATPTPSEPDLSSQRTAASDTTRLLTPVPGSIIRGYEKRRNDGIDIAAAPGTPVKAADAGTVAAITRDTDQVPIVVVRHEGNLLTVYAGVDDVTVEKGERVTRGQTIAAIRPGDPAFLHFEVREGFESVDPAEYLN